jgi:hypothetical protein
MNQTQEEHVAEVLARREAALLEIRVRALARNGKSISAAYRQPTPVKMKPKQFAQQWT